jgi:hypothetical protein
MLHASSPPEPPAPETLELERVLLASEEPSIPTAAIELAARLAGRPRARVHVFVLARIWGTSLGFPNPGLYPTRGEWDRQREIVTRAVGALEARGIAARGRVTGTRKGAKTIVGEAERLHCGAIVMAADPRRNALVADFMWSQEPYRVRRRAPMPVYLVERPVPLGGW